MRLVLPRLAITAFSVVLFGSLLTACTSGSSSSPAEPEPSKVNGAYHLTVGDDVSAAVKDRDYQVVDTIPSTHDGQILEFEGMASNGTQVFITTPAVGDGNPAIAVRDPDSGAITEVVRHKSRTWFQAFGAAVTGNVLVWIETPSRDLYHLPWDLYAYDVSTKKETHLASSKDLGIDNPPWPGIAAIVPQQIGDYVYFPAIYAIAKDAGGGEGSPGIYRVPIGGGEPELVAKQANEVFTDADPQLAQFWYIGGTLAAWDPTTRTRVEDSAVAAPNGGFSNEGTRITFNREAKQIDIYSPRYGRHIIDTTGAADAYYLNATERWASFTTAADETGEQQGYIVDLKRHTIRQQKGVQNSSVTRLHGNLVYAPVTWTDKPPATFTIDKLLPAD